MKKILFGDRMLLCNYLEESWKFMLFLGEVGTTTSSTGELEKEVTHRVSAIQKFWNNIDWDGLIAMVIGKAIYLVLAFILFLILYKLGRFLIERAYSNYGKRNAISQGRAATLEKLLDSIFQYSMFFILVYTVLTIIGIPVGSLLAGAGIAGLAIGLGAQGFMNDIITGFFIIMEQQLDVGDHIQLSNLSIDGYVVAVGIRTTKIKSLEGAIHYVPNRNITTITNLSRSDIRVVIDVRIKPEEGFDKISDLIEKTTEKLAEENKALIQKKPEVFGMVDLGNGNFAIRVTMYVVNGEQFKIQEAFLAEYVQVLTDNDYTIPNNPIGDITSSN
jgi:small conductance mechanosensitive channel